MRAARRARLRLALALVLVAIGCARAPNTALAPVVEVVTFEQMYLAERYGEVVIQATSVIEAERAAREQVAEARFFRALAWLAQDPQGEQERVLLELRTLEFEFSDLIWGRLAALQVAAAERVDALQATLLELLTEQRDLQARIEVLEQSLAEVHAAMAEQEQETLELARERNELVEQLEDAEAEAEATAVRVRELEDELAALKQIDMQREP